MLDRLKKYHAYLTLNAFYVEFHQGLSISELWAEVWRLNWLIPLYELDPQKYQAKAECLIADIPEELEQQILIGGTKEVLDDCLNVSISVSEAKNGNPCENFRVVVK